MANPINPNQLNDQQIDRLLIAVETLKQTNSMAQLICAALEKQTDREGKRRVLVTSFAQMYELMLVMQMAILSDVTPEAIQENLREKQRRDHAGSN